MRIIILLVCMCFILTGCTSLPITPDEPLASLPPSTVEHVAPIGDAQTVFTETTTLYLPHHGSNQLEKIEVDVQHSLANPKPESVVRALLAYPGDMQVRSLGGDVRLSLFGNNPVESSAGIVTVNLSASALRLEKPALYLLCQAITNTLTSLPGIARVNVLIADYPIGLDIANSLPMGTLAYSHALDVVSVYEQRLTRRITPDSPTEQELLVEATLYFPITNAIGIMSEVRTCAFPTQEFADMARVLLTELSSGSQTGLQTPVLTVLADMQLSPPLLRYDSEAGGNVVVFHFSHTYYDMLTAHQLQKEQALASLTYTFCTFFPNIVGVEVAVGKEKAEKMHLRNDFSECLYDNATLYFPTENGLQPVQHIMPYHQVNNPRYLLMELAKGPQLYDGLPGLLPITPPNAIADEDVLGIALVDDELVVNVALSFLNIGETMNDIEEKYFVYALVNTFCAIPPIKNVCFFVGGQQFDGFTGTVDWRGDFLPYPQ